MMQISHRTSAVSSTPYLIVFQKRISVLVRPLLGRPKMLLKHFLYLSIALGELVRNSLLSISNRNCLFETSFIGS